MKIIFTLLTLFFTTIASFSQQIEGAYTNKWLSNTGEGIEYTLTLQEDGQFIFNHRRIFMNDKLNTEAIIEGTWQIKGHLLVLNTSDDNHKLASKLDSNKARFVSVSPRHPEFNVIKPSLIFYESAMFYAKDMELIKTETSITSSE